jgi:hypothetical protein
MKIGISLCGISYNEKNIGNCYRVRDFRNSIFNFYNKIYSPLLNKGYEVSKYLCTYPHKYNEDMINLYKPKKVLFLKEHGSHQRVTFGMSLKMLQDEDLDVIIHTRFDFNLKKSITELNIDFEKFNFLCKDISFDERQFVSDLFYVYPKKYLSVFLDALVDMNKFKEYSFLHHCYNPIVKRIGIENTHFIEHNLFHGIDNELFELKRTELHLIDQNYRNLTW